MSEQQFLNPNPLNEDIANVVNDQEWQNAHEQEAGYLNPDCIVKIIDVFDVAEIDEEATSREKNIEGLGKLSYLGSGEAKTAMLLETDNGEKLVVKLTNWVDVSNGQEERKQSVYAPSDPKMVKIKSGLGKDLYEYSDLDTLLVVDTGRFELHFQEYGETREGTSDNIISAFRESVSYERAVRRLKKHIGNSNFTVPDNWLEGVESEMTKQRHRLHDDSGRVVLIDVPIEVLK